MTTPYQKGVRAEYLLANELREQGWTVIRSAGSHGPADLVAYKCPDVRFIQVKRCRSKPELRRAVKDSIDKFEESKIWYASYIWFDIKLYYKGQWLWVNRGRYSWHLITGDADLLGQTEWPITEREE